MTITKAKLDEICLYLFFRKHYFFCTVAFFCLFAKFYWSKVTSTDINEPICLPELYFSLRITEILIGSKSNYGLINWCEWSKINSGIEATGNGYRICNNELLRFVHLLHNILESNFESCWFIAVYVILCFVKNCFGNWKIILGIYCETHFIERLVLTF